MSTSPTSNDIHARTVNSYVAIPVEQRDPNACAATVWIRDAELVRLTAAADRHVKLAYLFSSQCIVPDAWRYTVTARDGKMVAQKRLRSTRTDLLPNSNYVDVHARSAVGQPIILLLLESPGDKEFEPVPDGSALLVKGPAQGKGPGKTGGAIKKYVLEALNEAMLGLPDGEYALVIANPIPYHCNLKLLASLTPQLANPDDNTMTADSPRVTGKTLNGVRDYVWQTLWRVSFVVQDFLERCTQYAPVAIINCCTGALQAHVSAALIPTFSEVLFEGPHPSTQWNIKYGRRKPAKTGSGTQAGAASPRRRVTPPAAFAKVETPSTTR
ncbi:hypothetical protein [Corallococcus exercitus]|uniref:hypothetical protein n=1 Tax=Corallococcus exercitus TaxID=2316736 RepID=UPI0035D3F210